MKSNQSKKIKGQKRQGDLLITYEKKPKGECQKVSDGIIAHGEVTGHMHRIAPADLSNCDVFVYPNGDMYVEPKTDKPVSLVHDTHGTTIIEKGAKIIRQREYDAAAREQERKVAD